MPTANPKKKETKNKKSSASLTSSPPPLECTAEEYQSLLTTASSLSPTEATTELLECARYGETDSVKALLETHTSKIPNYINTTDVNQSTALHKAASNGHVHTVQLLLYYKAQYLENKSLNTPLHWAAANGHCHVVEMILGHDFGFQLDVLKKNEFGRSILTEGFSYKGDENTKLVGMLLEHDSASEEKLLDGGEEVDVEDDDNGNENDVKRSTRSKVDGGGDDDKIVEGDIKLNANGDITSATNDDGQSTNSSNTDTDSTGRKSGIIHEFNFLKENKQEDDVNASVETDGTNDKEIQLITEESKTLLIRELPIKNADTPFGETAIDDTTGLGIWSASLVMARWMASKSILGRFDHKTVLELGAGCGVPGLTVGLYSHAKSVYVTDFNPSTVQNLKYNIEVNANRSATKYSNWIERIHASSIDWDDQSTWPDDKMDFIIGSDLIYQKSIVPLLKKVVAGLLKPDGQFLYTCPSDGRDGLVEFIDTMKKEGFRCTSEEVAPDLYKSNPLSSGDEEDAFLHFYELPVTEYKLYEFKIVQL